MSIFSKFKSEIANKICWINILLLAVFVLLSVTPYVIRMGYSFEINYNEGYNVFNSIKAASGNDLYDSKANVYKTVNYPPLSFYIIGYIGNIVGNPLIVGRSISLLSLFLISICVAVAVIKLGGAVYDAVFTGIFCLGLFTTYASSYVGVNDPQILGHLFEMAGLLFYLDSRTKNINIFLVALLFSLGIFIKHNLIALPLAVALDLFFQSRRNFIKYVLYCITFGLFFVCIVLIVSGYDFINEVLLIESSRIFSIRKLILKTTDLVYNIQIPFTVTLLIIFYNFREINFRIISIYYLLALVIGIYFSGVSGININIFFDFLLSMAIASGMILCYYRKYILNMFNYSKLIYFFLPMFLFFGILVKVPENIITFDLYSLFIEKERRFQEDVAFLKGYSGPVLCESVLLCYFGNKRYEYDSFQVQQSILSGKIKEEKILNIIESGYFSIVQTNRKPINDIKNSMGYGPVVSYGRFTVNIMRALNKHYTLLRETGERTFYVRNNELLINNENVSGNLQTKRLRSL